MASHAGKRATHNRTGNVGKLALGQIALMATFTKDDGRAVPAEDRFLLRALTPTACGTNYWDPPPPAPLSERQKGRIILQTHQLVQAFRMAGVELAGKHLLDIGTGNGLVPRLLLEISELDRATGIDPFLDGEHKTSWQPHDHDNELKQLREFIFTQCGGRLEISTYERFLGHENYSMRPEPICLTSRNAKSYRFEQISGHDLPRLKEKFELFYCKAIEHIPDWPGLFRAMASAASKGCVAYFKHRPFFSYLGPHRYASTLIPWGHALMTDEEYRRYVHEFHSHRADAMLDFYFNGLAYPRYSVSDMLRIAAEAGFGLRLVVIEPPRYLPQVVPFIDEVDEFWEIKRSIYPEVSSEELFSGIYHVIFEYGG
jgi:hypothetical protein